MEQGNFLGIDWGKRKIGLALAHSETGVAVAFGLLENDANIFTKLKKVFVDEEITTVVIGVPQRQQATRHPSQDFGEKLKSLGVRVVFSNEMFTSKLAQDNLLLQGYRHVARHDDAEAAKILLQGWLDQQG